MSAQTILADPSITVIFATSPTGLGHLRVTEALYSGLPHTVAPVLLGAQDQSVSALYRFVSIHPLTRRVMTVLQLPPLDKPFAIVGRTLLRMQTKLLYQQLKTILSERLVVPKTVLLVAPHTILGHQLGAIKAKMAKELGIDIILIVQVTDDSPQAIWYVYDADLLLVPSHYTEGKLKAYARRARLPEVPMVVTAYPISPLFAEELSETAYASRVEQTESDSMSTIHMTVPVSGAAVGTRFISDFIISMHSKVDRMLFHVVSREAPYTRSFIQKVSQLPYVQLHTSDHDRTTVLNYEQVFHDVPVALEVTKPSEQAFKALATPKQRGGPILLFSDPVGGQEYDNLHFLRNHGLMPSKADTHHLWKLAKYDEPLTDESLLAEAHHWRALRLPSNPHKASTFVMWCLKQKIFYRMMHYTHAMHAKELQSNGVEQFWGEVEKVVEKHVTRQH